MAFTDLLSMENVMDLVQVAGTEITMFACAAFLYVAFSGGFGRVRGAKTRKTVKPVMGSNDLTRACDIQTLQESVRSGSLEAAADFLRDRGSDGEKVLDCAIADAFQRKDFHVVRRLYELCRALNSKLSTKSFEAFAKAYHSDAAVLRALVQESTTPISKAFAKMILQSCTLLKDTDLVFEVFEKASSVDAADLREFVEKANETSNAPDARRKVVVPNSQNISFKQVRAFGKDGDLASAVATFEKELPRSGSSRSTIFLYNSIIEACVQNNDVNQAFMFFSRARTSGMVDVVSYNLLMKGYLAGGNLDRAEEVLAELLQSEVKPNESSFHGLLNARMTSTKASLSAAWRIVDRMQAAGVKPNAVTCSILLKGATVQRRAQYVGRVISMVESVDITLDDVFLSSAVEACLHTGQLPLLAKLVNDNVRRLDGAALSAPTYGSMIKAFGQAGDVKTVSGLWTDMCARKVEPTETTLGCMVEALVTNNRHSDAYQLVEQVWSSEKQRPLVNTVIYSTLLKGLGRQPAKAMSIYEEMTSRGIPCNLISYNTILNTMALNGAMDCVPRILADMANASPAVAPDIVTFSTLIKGFCSSGDLSKALELFEDMKKDGNHKLDEVVYNSLLDGCAKEQRVDDLLKLVAEMKDQGVIPSNYTLSMLVKCLGRCRRLAQAFSLVESISQEYGFRLNIQVYTCLIQACFQNRKLAKAIALLDQLESDGLRADEKVFTVLVRGCLQAGNADKAVEMVKRAFSGDWAVGVDARTLDEVTTKLGRNSEAAKAFLAEVEISRRQQAEKHSSGRHSSAAHAQQARWAKAGDRAASGFATAKKVAARQTASSCASTTSGSNSSGSDSGL